MSHIFTALYLLVRLANNGAVMQSVPTMSHNKQDRDQETEELSVIEY
jgi:hypothetical protein